MSWTKNFLQIWGFLLALVGIVCILVEEDKEELFPHGKWATIQRMEKLLADCLKEYRSVRR